MAGVRETFAEIKKQLRTPIVAQIGGFRPPEDPCTSWFARGVHHPDEPLPMLKGQPMFPLLQIRCAELPEVPSAFAGPALVVIYVNATEIPFDLPHGEGWLVREYRSIDALVPCSTRAPAGVKPMGIKWSAGKPERPDWEQASESFDMDAIADSDSAKERFDAMPHHGGTKIGGYPSEVQGLVENADDYVLQIGSEAKVGWAWADSGVATFARDANGRWTFACQSL